MLRERPFPRMGGPAETGPLRDGGGDYGVVIVPTRVPVPMSPAEMRSSVPLPVAPAKLPVPPSTVQDET